MVMHFFQEFCIRYARSNLPIGNFDFKNVSVEHHARLRTLFKVSIADALCHLTPVDPVDPAELICGVPYSALPIATVSQFLILFLFR